MLISNGHVYTEIRNKYTISQVYLFAEKIKKMELDKDRMNAIVMSNCLVYATPANDISDARKKNRAFREFIDSLVWDKLVEVEEDKEKPRSATDAIKRLFGGASLPIKIRTKE
jgi:hypothetical protein